MDLTQITRIVELMSKHDLTEIDIKSEELALTIKRERQKEVRQEVQMIPAMQQMMPQPLQATPAAPLAAAPAADVDPNHGLKPIESPLVGTFYSAPSPDAPPYVKPGDEVSEETVVCIIEAMKVLNEIKAETRGIIRKVLVENAQPVEFGQPLFYIEPR